MRTIKRARSRHSNIGLFRVGSLVMLGALVWMLWSGARDPQNWKWLAPEQDNQTAISTPVHNPSLETSPETEEPQFAGPVDSDGEQQEAAEEEFQAVSDGTLELQKEEMPAYWRLFLWTKSQSPQQMLKRATNQISLDDLLRRSSSQRGKLIKLDLNLRRALSYEAPLNDVGVTNVNEIWGWSEATKSWLYVGVTAELPKNMPRGAEIYERVTFVGYFLKVQGYQAAKSRPNEKPLSAPLLVGRIIWHPAPVAAAPKEDPWWMWLGMAGAAISFVGGCWYITSLWRQPPRMLPSKHIDLSNCNRPDFPSDNADADFAANDHPSSNAPTKYFSPN